MNADISLLSAVILNYDYLILIPEVPTINSHKNQLKITLCLHRATRISKESRVSRF